MVPVLVKHVSEAEAYVASVKETTDRILLELAIRHAQFVLSKDSAYLDEIQVEQNRRLDLLTYAQLVHNLLQQRAMVMEILSGKYESLEQVCNKLGAW